MRKPGDVMVLRSGCAHWVSFWGVVAHGVKVARVVGNGVAVGVCAMGFVLGVIAHGVKVAWVVGDGVAVGVRPDVVRAWLIVGARLPRSGRGCGGSVWRVCSQLRSCPDCELCDWLIKV